MGDRKIKSVIVETIGNILEKKFIKEMDIDVEYVESIVAVE
jgi:hypothetical protein